MSSLLEFPVKYWSFIFRLVPPHHELRGIDVIPHFEVKVVIWSVIFSLLHIVIPVISKWLYPKWYASLEERKRREFPAYLACLFHHFAMVPRGIAHVYQDYIRPESELATIQYASLEATIAPFCIGYLVGDTLFYALPQMFRKDFEMIIHHIMTLWIVCSAIWAPGHFCRYIPHLMMCDLTNVFFNTAWILRAAGYQNKFITTLELLFAFSFLFVRAINLPAVFLAIQLVPDADQLGWARLPMMPIGLMQWWWFAIIVNTTRQRLFPKKKKIDSSSGHSKSLNDSNTRKTK